jgi:hypothetical protein
MIATNEIEEFILSLITCKVCNEVFNDPIILPCHKTICCKDIFNETKNSLYTCYFCKQKHLIIVTELVNDEEKNELIKKRNKYLKRDLIEFENKNRITKVSLKLFTDTIEQAKLVTNDPISYIDSYFGKLKNKIDLTKLRMIETIEESHKLILNEINGLENECKLKSEKETNDLLNLIQEAESKRLKWTELISEPDLSKEKEWKSIICEASTEMKAIKNKINEYQENLLLNNDYLFDPLPVINKIGDFYIRNVEKGTIQMVIDNFSNFNSTLEYRESKETCIIQNITWIIKTRIDNKNEINFLRVIVKPNCSNEKFKNNPIDTKLTFKIIQNEAKKVKLNLETTKYHKFENSNGYGVLFHSKEQLLNPNNGIYNRKNDSILIEAIIKILN